MSFTFVSSEKIDSLAVALTRSGVTREDLLCVLDRTFVSTIRHSPVPLYDLMELLHHLNGIESLVTNSVPLLDALRHALTLLEVSRSFDRHLVRKLFDEVWAQMPEASRAHYAQREDPTPDLSSRGDSASFFSVAAAGIAGGVAVAALVYTLGPDSDGIANVPVLRIVLAGAFDAVLIRSVAERIHEAALAESGLARARCVRASLVGLVCGAAIPVLAEAAAHPLRLPERTCAAASVTSAVVVLFTAWSRGMRAPTTILRALWNGFVAASGALTGYSVYAATIQLLAHVRTMSSYPFDPSREAVFHAGSAFVFVTVFQGMLALRLHGLSAWRTQQSAAPQGALVPRGVHHVLVAGTILATVAHVVLAVLLHGTRLPWEQRPPTTAPPRSTTIGAKWRHEMVRFLRTAPARNESDLPDGSERGHDGS